MCFWGPTFPTFAPRPFTTLLIQPVTPVTLSAPTEGDSLSTSELPITLHQLSSPLLSSGQTDFLYRHCFEPLVHGCRFLCLGTEVGIVCVSGSSAVALSRLLELTIERCML
ncbi:hypothetical protein F5Y01DRAFT_236357 [Xylaria sp. FL0043]|nr:hypothetical protein F5Y01DRAFT_236357 [Xylaria sp. FL0043]